MKVAPETQNGTTVRLKGKGFPVYKQKDSFGDLFVTYQVQLPKNLTEKQKELFEQLKKFIVMEERISREDIVRLYNIEITFFDDLASSGLIQTEVINNTTYLHYDQLSAFERFTNWHYDLEVNMAGLEIIHRLLQQIEELRGVKLN